MSYLKADQYLRNEFVRIFFDNEDPDPTSLAVVRKFAGILNRRLKIKTISNAGLIRKAIAKASPVPYPEELPVPAELLVELMVEESDFTRTIPAPILKKLGACILADTVLLEKLFVSSGLSNPAVISRFDLKLDPPSWKEMNGRLDLGRRAGRTFVMSMLQKGVLFSAAAGLLFNRAWAKSLGRLPFLKRFRPDGRIGAGTSLGIIAAASIMIFTGGEKVTDGHADPADPAPGQGTVFRWQLPEKTSLNMHKSGTVKIYVDGQLFKQQQEYNIANFICHDREGDRAAFKGIFKTFTQKPGSKSRTLVKESTSRFIIRNNGEYLVAAEHDLPNVRSIPQFPARALKPGSSWQAPYQLNYYDLDPPFMVTGKAAYTYLSNVTVDGRHCAKFKVSYSFNKPVMPPDKASSTKQVGRIAGNNKGMFLWDLQAQTMYKHNEVFNETITKLNGEVIEHRMNFRSKYNITTPMPGRIMKKASKGISDRLKEFNHIETWSDRQGIHISLGEIYFSFDQYDINEQARIILDTLRPVLSDFTNYEIVVAGFSDDTGSRENSLRLTDRRARSVGDYLVKKDQKISPRLYTKGYGAENPRHDNTDPKLRYKNRRVEIVIRQSGE